MPQNRTFLVTVFAICIFFNLPLVAQSNVVWQIQTCRITTEANGNFLLCEQQIDCANQTTGSRIDCSVYTYTTVTKMSDCISKCCFQLSPVPTNLTGPLIQSCYDQYQTRRVLFVVKVVMSVVGGAALIVTSVAIYFLAFTRNPYTGKRVWVGCCCCKKVADFQKERNYQVSSLQNIQNNRRADGITANQKKIKKIQIG